MFQLFRRRLMIVLLSAVFMLVVVVGVSFAAQVTLGGAVTVKGQLATNMVNACYSIQTSTGVVNGCAPVVGGMYETIVPTGTLTSLTVTNTAGQTFNCPRTAGTRIREGGRGTIVHCRL